MSARTTLIRSILVLACLECVAWAFMSAAFWLLQNGLIGQNSPQEVAQAQEAAGASLAAAVLNAIALMAFMRGGRGIGLWLMAAVQAAALTSSGLVILQPNSPDPDLFAIIGVVSAATLILTAAFWWTSRSRGSREAVSGPL